MEKDDIILYGIRNGKVVHINELDELYRGKKCNCICPNCGGTLIARMGNIRINHFAHLNRQCDHNVATETALHRLAKEILLESGKIKLPEVILNYNDYSILNNEYVIKNGIKEKTLSNEVYINILDVTLEKRVDDIVPDVIIKTIGNKEILVEIAVTHFVDSNKIFKIKNKNIPTIEIDLHDFYKNNTYNRNKLKEIIVNDCECKYWIYNEKLSKAEIEENNKAEMKRKLIENKIKEIEHTKEIKEAEKAKKRDYAIKMSQISRPNKKIRIANRINGYTPYEYSKKDIDSMKNSLTYKELIKKLNINEDHIPYIFKIPLPGEYSFDCNRILLEMSIYNKFIYKRAGKSIYLVNVINWVNKYSKIPINPDFKYCKNEVIIQEAKIPTAYEAVKYYLEYLHKVGLLSTFYNNDKIKYGEELHVNKPDNEYIKKMHIKYIEDIKNTNTFCTKCGEITRDIISYIDNDRGICKSCIIDAIKEVKI